MSTLESNKHIKNEFIDGSSKHRSIPFPEGGESWIEFEKTGNTIFFFASFCALFFADMQYQMGLGGMQ